MKVYNYSCNDEIDRKSCILSWDVENDSYKIGKHKVPSLDDVIEAIIHKRSKNKDRKNRILFSLRKFLHSGTKTTGDDLEDIEKTFRIAESENYAHTLKPFINENGYYKETTDKNIMSHFAYNKKIEDIKDDFVFEKYIKQVQQELDNQLNNEAHYEELKQLEAHLIRQILGDIKIENKDVQNVAWFSKIEKVSLPHYHLAKKQSIRENIYYAGMVDLVTKDTLYYLDFNDEHSIDYIILYLNIINIDLKKQNLKLLCLGQNGNFIGLNLPCISEINLNKIISSYRNKELCDFSLLPKYNSFLHKDSPYSSQTVYTLDAYSFISSLVSSESFFEELGFSIYTIIPDFIEVFAQDSLKRTKAKVAESFIFALKLIIEVYQKTDVQTTFLFIDRLRDIVFTEKGFAYTTLRMLYLCPLVLEEAIIQIQKNYEVLGKSLKMQEIKMNNEKMQKIAYTDTTLQLKLNAFQKDALVSYLKSNLLQEENLKQIIDIRDKKGVKTLSGKELNTFSFYKKTECYEGCIQSQRYVNVIIANAALVYSRSCKNILEDVVLFLHFKNMKTGADYQHYIDVASFPEGEKSAPLIHPNFNALVTLFFDTFSIKRGNFNLSSWIGCKGELAIKDADDKSFRTAKGSGVMYIKEEN